MGSLRFICFVCLVPVSKYVKLEENSENICIERTPCHINLINIKTLFCLSPFELPSPFQCAALWGGRGHWNWAFFWLATWVKGHSKGFYDWKLLNESFLLYNSNYYPIIHNVIIPWCAESASQTTTYTKQNAPIILPKTFAKSLSFDNSLEQVLNTKKDAWNSMNKSHRNDKYSWPWNALKRCLSFRS